MYNLRTFVKPLLKYNKSTKQRYNIYQLCESFRLDGRILHRVIIGLGGLEELSTVQDKKLPLHQPDESVERLARYYFGEIKKKGRYYFGESSPDW